jgi:two-component system, NtrC family, sensor kinase
MFYNFALRMFFMAKVTHPRISLRTKFIIFIGAIISLSYIFILYRTSVFDESMIIRQAEQQARMLYKQILLTREWASDHNGLFILKRQGLEENPFLELPTVQDSNGNIYLMRNPAMITRELSEYAKRDGLGHFRVTSLKPINPVNSPDNFEKQSMLSFQEGVTEKIAVRESPFGRVVRFMSPLTVSDSCLGCHKQHGYSFGDIRGALSITIPIEWADSLIKRNSQSLILIGIISVFLVIITLFLMFESLVVQRIARLSEAMDAYPDEHPEPKLLPSVFKDELDTIDAHFISFCERLNISQEELIKTRSQAHFNEKMASLGILTAGIAHEVNNPLGGMLNCVKTMRENPNDSVLHQRYLPLLDKGLRQIENTMRQLLNFGRTEPLSLRQVDLKALFKECTELFQFKLKNISMHVDVTISKQYMLDAEALKQIIINIGLNAIQAMPDGGTLKISCSKESEYLIIIFEDSGTGIAKEDLPHIFDPFFTTKDVGEGTGLGLAVTYSLVQKMKGEIDVKSEIHTGTVFSITIPIIGDIDLTETSDKRSISA